MITDGLAALANAVAHALHWSLRLHTAGGRDRASVGMAAGRANRINRDEHARPDHPPIVDRVPQSDIDVISRADIAHRCETGIDRLSRERRRQQRLLSGLAHHLVEEIEIPVVSCLLGEMHVRVDESRQQRCVPQIDDPCVGRNCGVRADGSDALAINDDHRILNDSVGRPIKQPRSFDHRWLRKRERGEEEQSDDQLFHDGAGI